MTTDASTTLRSFHCVLHDHPQRIRRNSNNLMSNVVLEFLQIWWICHVDFWLKVSPQKKVSWSQIWRTRRQWDVTKSWNQTVWKSLLQQCHCFSCCMACCSILLKPSIAQGSSSLNSWNKKFSYHNSVSFTINCWSCSIITFEEVGTKHRGGSYSTPHSDTRRVQRPFLDFLRVFVSFFRT